MGSIARALVVLSLLAGAPVVSLAQDAPPATPSAVDTAFADLEAKLAELGSVPPGELQGRLFRELQTAAGAFLDTHLQVASAAQVNRAAQLWFGIQARTSTPEAAVRARLEQVSAAPNKNEELAGLLRLIDAQLNLREGSIAPIWTAVDVKDGSQVTLEGLRGKLVLMDFWATWCGPCLRLMKEKLAPLHAKWGQDSRFVLVGLGLGSEGETVEMQRDYAEAQGYHWKKVFDAPGVAGQLYGTDSIPFLCLVDEEGKILVMGRGFSVFSRIERVIDERLGAPQAAEGN